MALPPLPAALTINGNGNANAPRRPSPLAFEVTRKYGGGK
jgi:hypothetical protein